MVKEERFSIILKHLSKKTMVFYPELSALLKVSEDTVRRDINALDRNGLLKKIRGGAILIEKLPVNFVDRSTIFEEEKKKIALKAISRIKEGNTIFMDGGTTNCAIGESLPIDFNLRIVTNNLALVPILSNRKSIELILLGGVYNTSTQTTFDTQTIQDAAKYVADLYFLGACAFDTIYGVTSVFREEAELKRTMHLFSKQTIVLANSKKLNTAEAFKVCDADEIDTLITELPGTDQILDSYRDENISIL